MSRVKLEAPEGVMIEVDEETVSRFEALPNTRQGRRKTWTPEDDALLLKYYELKTKESLCEIFGVTDKTLRRRYRDLLTPKLDSSKPL